MIAVSLSQMAKESGRKFALEHPFADRATAMKQAGRLFETAEQRNAFFEAWRREAGF